MNNKAGLAVVAGALWLGFTGVKKLILGDSGKGFLKTEQVQKILRELECQMFIACTHFAHLVEPKLRMAESEADREELRAGIQLEMSKVYQEKRRRLLVKFEIDPEIYAKSVSQNMAASVECRQLVESIQDMMEEATRGRVPDSNIPSEYKKQFPPQRMIVLLRDMLTAIANTIYREYKAKIEISDFALEDFDKVMNKVDIQAIKEEHLKKEKFSRTKDHNPNMVDLKTTQTFNKLLEQYKKADTAVKRRLKHLEMKYQEVIENISIHIGSLTETDITNMMKSINIHLEDPNNPNKLNRSNMTTGPLTRISEQAEEEEGESPNQSVRTFAQNRSLRTGKAFKLKAIETYAKMKQYSQLFTNSKVNPYLTNRTSLTKLVKVKSRDRLEDV